MSQKVDVNQLRLLHDKVMITDMNFDSVTTQSGIILNSDDGKSEGIKPRWGKILAVGPEQRDVQPGEWVLVSHGRWTRGFELVDGHGQPITVRFVDVKEMLMTADEPPNDFYVGEHSSDDHRPTQVHRPEHFI